MNTGTTPNLVTRLEELSDRAMPGTDRALVGAWRLRAALGVTSRANSAWAPDGSSPDGTEAVAAAVDQVEIWYRRRDMTPRFQLYDGADAELVAELDRRHWTANSESLVMVADIDKVMASTPGSASTHGGDDRSVETATKPTSSFRRLLDDDRRLMEMTATELPQRFVTVFDGDGRPLGGGMTTIDGAWTAMLSMITQPEARRRGVATSVLITLASVATEIGADKAWLQVEADNVGAVALYRRLGFATAHRYRYRAAPE